MVLQRGTVGSPGKVNEAAPVVLRGNSDGKRSDCSGNRDRCPEGGAAIGGLGDVQVPAAGVRPERKDFAVGIRLDVAADRGSGGLCSANLLRCAPCSTRPW